MCFVLRTHPSIAKRIIYIVSYVHVFCHRGQDEPNRKKTTIVKLYHPKILREFAEVAPIKIRTAFIKARLNLFWSKLSSQQFLYHLHTCLGHNLSGASLFLRERIRLRIW